MYINFHNNTFTQHTKPKCSQCIPVKWWNNKWLESLYLIARVPYQRPLLHNPGTYLSNPSSAAWTPIELQMVVMNLTHSFLSRPLPTGASLPASETLIKMQVKVWHFTSFRERIPRTRIEGSWPVVENQDPNLILNANTSAIGIG